MKTQHSPKSEQHSPKSEQHSPKSEQHSPKSVIIERRKITWSNGKKIDRYLVVNKSDDVVAVRHCPSQSDYPVKQRNISCIYGWGK